MSSPQVISGPPKLDHPVPAAVREAAESAELTGVWLNAEAGITYRMGSGPESRYAKWQPGNPPVAEVDLYEEARRMWWAQNFITVPEVISCEQFTDGQLLITATLPGHSAVSDLGKADPQRSAFAVGVGLRQLHDSIPTDLCPFSWDLESRISQLPEELRSRFLAEVPELDLVVCHGDACLPNSLITEDYGFVGHVDLGNLGVADRWADLSIAAWSTQWNFGPGFEDCIYDGYGIERDEQKIAFYREVWDAT